MSNTNGNITLFLSTLFAALAPGYKLLSTSIAGLSVYFYFIPLTYSILFFMEHMNMDDHRIAVQRHAKNDNETHYVALGLGVLFGSALKFRLGL